MAVLPTEKEFLRYVNTKYRVNVDTPEPVELELVEVKPYENQPGEQEGMERFSLYFYGPPDIYLPQRIYRLSHSQMEDLDIFLVPIGRNERGYRYESVFNFRTASTSS